MSRKEIIELRKYQDKHPDFIDKQVLIKLELLYLQKETVENSIKQELKLNDVRKKYAIMLEEKAQEDTRKQLEWPVNLQDCM